MSEAGGRCGAEVATRLIVPLTGGSANMVRCTRGCVTSGRGRNPCGMDDGRLDAPLRTAEFLAVDTETNGRGGDAAS